MESFRFKRDFKFLRKNLKGNFEVKMIFQLAGKDLKRIFEVMSTKVDVENNVYEFNNSSNNNQSIK